MMVEYQKKPYIAADYQNKEILELTEKLYNKYLNEEKINWLELRN